MYEEKIEIFMSGYLDDVKRPEKWFRKNVWCVCVCACMRAHQSSKNEITCNPKID